MGSAPFESEVVYRGMDVVTLALIEERLRLEGFRPQRLGKVDPALLGAGTAALEQLIAVPKAEAQAARALIEATQREAADPDHEAELEAQALRARYVPEGHGAEAEPLDAWVVTAALGLGVFVLLLVMLGAR